jgi:hypothetical protein
MQSPEQPLAPPGKKPEHALGKPEQDIYCSVLEQGNVTIQTTRPPYRWAGWQRWERGQLLPIQILIAIHAFIVAYLLWSL